MLLQLIIVEIWLGRRLLHLITTIYIPSLMLIIIGHLTHYFKPNFFECCVGVNLIVMLVLTSMMLSVMETLPRTASVKMLEIWMFLSLTFPFFNLFLHFVLECLR